MIGQAHAATLVVVSSPDSNAASQAYAIPPTPIVLGRASPANLVVADPMISRRHVEMAAVAGGIHVRDLGSSNGTFVNDQPVSGIVVTPTDVLRMGNTTFRVHFGTAASADQQRSPWYRRPSILIVAAVVLALFGTGVAVAINRASGGSSPTGAGHHTRTTHHKKKPTGGQPAPKPQSAGFTPDLVGKLERSTVLLDAYDADGNLLYTGSGTIIRPDGIILTNAHVGAPDAAGLGLSEGGVETPPATLEVSMITKPNKPAKPRYQATPILADGYLDAAVLRISAAADGTPVDTATLHLPFVPLGRSNTLQPGDEIGVIGYPAIGGGQQGFIDYANGTVSGWVADSLNRIGPNAWLKTSARIAPGNSGGLAADSSGRIIGIPTQNISQNNPAQVQYVSEGRIRPIAAVKPVIEAALNGTASSYVSPYFVPASGQEHVTLDGWANSPPDENCSYDAVNSYPSAAAKLTAVFTASGMSRGEDVVMTWNYQPTPGAKPVWLGDSHTTWKPPSYQCFVATLPGETDATDPQPTRFQDNDATAADGIYTVYFRFGPNLLWPKGEAVTVGSP